MYILLGMLAGMLLSICPHEFIWLPLTTVLLVKPKQCLPSFIIGYVLVDLNLAKLTVPNHPITVNAQQISPSVNGKARLAIAANPYWQQSVVVQAKLPKDFYTKTAKCSMSCQPLRANAWYARSQGIVADCKVYNYRVLGDNFTAKYQLARKIPNKLDNSSVFQALLLGQSQLIPSAKKQLFKFAGLAHLIAVSGLHIGIIAAVTGYLFGLIWQLALKIFWRIPKSAFINTGQVFGATTYAWLSGFGDSSCRALAMVLVASGLKQLKLKVSSEQILFIAIIIILILKPLSVFSLGLWLSALAVWALLNAKNNFSHAQFNIFLVMLPIQALYKWPIGWWMPIANFIAIPLFSFCIVPAAFIAWLLEFINHKCASYLWLLLDKTLSCFFKVLSIAQQQFKVGFYLPFASNWQILLLGLVAYLLIRARIRLAIIITLMLCYDFRHEINYADFKITVLDVGQGLSVIIRTQHHQLLLDTGERFAGPKVVLPNIRGFGINKLDKIIVSHGDGDHSGSIDYIADHIAFDEIIAGEPERIKPQSKACGNRSWLWDGVVFSTYQVHIDNKHNNESCILHVQSLNKSALFPGDIEANAEQELIQQVEHGSLKSDILVAAHHGSISSNSRAFMAAVRPKTIVISAGPYARYKHPAKSHMRDWQAQNIKVLNTYDLGNINL